jgi:hypothetical protein
VPVGWDRACEPSPGHDAAVLPGQGAGRYGRSAGGTGEADLPCLLRLAHTPTRDVLCGSAPQRHVSQTWVTRDRDLVEMDLLGGEDGIVLKSS